MLKTTTPDGTTIAYEDSGQDQARTVVVVHGITESRESLRPILDRLAAGDNRVIALDLRGHGLSGTATSYDLAAMVSDVVAVVEHAGVSAPHLLGHSLGGVVVSAVGSVLPVASVMNVDQLLQLGAFKEMLTPVEPMLRDAASFPAVMEGLFAQLVGDMLPADQVQRLADLRRPAQDVVLGVWDVIFSQPAEQVNAIVEQALAGYRSAPVPYLSLFGSAPETGYDTWLEQHVPGAVVEVWEDHGHYPHLVDPERFLVRLEAFWASASRD